MNITSVTPRNKSGFTLIELLTVIAIIGILAAIIIPTVGRVRQSARESVNKSNLRQIGLSANIYANDNKDRFPVAYNNGTGDQWFDLMANILYSSNAGRYTQKGDKIVTISPTALIKPPEPLARSTNHYSMHGLLGGTPDSGRFLNGQLARTGVPRPTQVILFADGVQEVSTTTTNAKAAWTKPSNGGIEYNYTGALDVLIPSGTAGDVGTTYELSYRNSESVHAAMVDGSVKAFKRGTVTYGNIVAWR